ncbi:MAG: hypothetical protein ACLPXB_15990 [Thiobacillaceae bacterium]
MAETEQPALQKETKASLARKATGWLVLPYAIGALAVGIGFPLQWNVFGFKFILILVPVVLAIKAVPIKSKTHQDKWSWRHFLVALIYLSLVSWLVFRNPVLLGCCWGVCF